MKAAFITIAKVEIWIEIFLKILKNVRKLRGAVAKNGTYISLGENIPPTKEKVNSMMVIP